MQIGLRALARHSARRIAQDVHPSARWMAARLKLIASQSIFKIGSTHLSPA
jgi:hypothetical protein